jgi:hypothetical protein
MKLLIWSKDRACQLDILLKSIKQNIKFSADVVVLYKYSDEKYQAGYEVLSKEHDWVSFKREENFYSDTIKEVSGTEYICFFTDDCFFFDTFNFEKRLLKFCLAFSYRLGLNTTTQHTLGGIKQPALNRYLKENDILIWKWNEYYNIHDYGYPMSVDGHVFLESTILPILNKIQFNNPNQLESAMFYQKEGLSPYMSSYEHSKMVNVPVNNMSGATRFGAEHFYSIEELNSEFLNGSRFTYDLTGQKIHGAHQEFPIICTNKIILTKDTKSGV